MTGLVRAELAKLRSLRTTWVLAALALLSCVLWTVLAATVFDGHPSRAGVPADQRVLDIYRMARQGYPFVLIMGALGMTGEYRYQTITWAFLVSPVRERVLGAKAAAHVVAGLLIGVAAAVTTTVCAVVLLAAAGKGVVAPQVPLVLVGCVLSTVAYTVLGLAIGGLVQNQVAAIAVAFGWFYYAESLLQWFLPAVARWLPSGAATAMIGGQSAGGGDLLPLWGGALLFVGYVVVVGAGAHLVTLRRDVT